MSAMAPNRKKQAVEHRQQPTSGCYESPRRIADEIGLHAYAAMCLELELAVSAAQRAEVFALFKSSEDVFRTIDRYWRALFAADESLHRDFQRLYEMQRMQLRFLRRRR
jgi:hypothetical protein